MAMRDTVAVAGWVGGAMLICVSLMVLCQHAEGERTRAVLQAEQAHVDSRIRTLDARLTDMQADANRKRLASVANPPLDPKRLAKASKELDQLIARSPTPPASAPTPPAAGGPEMLSGPAVTGSQGAAPFDPAAPTTGPAAGELVRVCPGGHFYHRAGCKRVKKQTMSLTRAAAEHRGWKPCPTCQP
jgi:hypothetical protein